MAEGGTWRTLAQVQLRPRINVWIRVWEVDDGTFQSVEQVRDEAGTLAQLARLLRKLLVEKPE